MNKRVSKILLKNPNFYKELAERKLSNDPNHFSKISKLATKPRGGKASSGSFDSERAIEAAKKKIGMSYNRRANNQDFDLAEIKSAPLVDVRT